MYVKTVVGGIASVVPPVATCMELISKRTAPGRNEVGGVGIGAYSTFTLQIDLDGIDL